MKMTDKTLKAAEKAENKAEKGIPLNRKERRLLVAANRKLSK